MMENAPSSAHLCEEARRDDVNAGKGERLHLKGGPHQFRLSISLAARRPQSWPCSSKSR